MNAPTAERPRVPAIRHRVDPGDVSADKAARRLGLTVADFEAHLPKLLARGFPAADVTTGLFDLDAIDAWRRRRNPHLFGLTSQPAPCDDRSAVRARLERMRVG